MINKYMKRVPSLKGFKKIPGKGSPVKELPTAPSDIKPEKVRSISDLKTILQKTTKNHCGR